MFATPSPKGLLVLHVSYTIALAQFAKGYITPIQGRYSEWAIWVRTTTASEELVAP